MLGKPLISLCLSFPICKLVDEWNRSYRMGISKDDSVSQHQHSQLPQDPVKDSVFQHQHSQLPQDPVNCDLLDISANLLRPNNANFNRTAISKEQVNAIVSEEATETCTESLEP